MNTVERPTKPLGPPIHGNYVFARAAYALGIDIMTARRLLAEALRTRNVDPTECQDHDVWAVLPVIYLLLRRTLSETSQIVDVAMAGLRAHLAEL